MSEQEKSGELRFFGIPAFWCFAVPYCILWTILCTIFRDNYQDDVLEQFYLGDRWALGSPKHPFLFSWFLNFIRLLLFDAKICPYLAAALFVLAILWGIWQLARDFFQDETLAFLVVLIAACFHYLQLGYVMFNHDLFQTLCWIMVVLYSYRALTENRLSAWLLLGLWAGLGLHTKYTILIFFVAVPVFMLLNRQARQLLKTKGPYCALAMATVVFLPHVIWLIQNDFVTLSYVTASMPHRIALKYPNSPIPLFLLTILNFSGKALLTILLPLIASVPLTGFLWQWKKRKGPDEKSGDRFRAAFLTTMVLLPFLLHLLIIIGGKYLPTRYVMTVGILVPFWLLYRLRLRSDRRAILRTTVLGLSLLFVVMTLWAGGIAYDVRYGKIPPLSIFPGKKLANLAEQAWTDHYENTPCPYVKDMLYYTLSINVYHYGKMKIPVNSRLLTADSTNQRMNDQGGIVLWDMRLQPEINAKTLRKRFPRIRVLEPLVIPYEKPFSDRFEPERFGIALIPPPE